MRAKGIDKYVNATTSTVYTIYRPGRRGNPERYALRIFIKLNTCAYRKVRKSRQRSVRIHSTLCEVACAENSCVKIAVVNIDRTVASVITNRIVRGIANSCVISITHKLIIVVSTSCE